MNKLDDSSEGKDIWTPTSATSEFCLFVPVPSLLLSQYPFPRGSLRL